MTTQLTWAKNDDGIYEAHVTAGQEPGKFMLIPWAVTGTDKSGFVMQWVWDNENADTYGDEPTLEAAQAFAQGLLERWDQ